MIALIGQNPTAAITKTFTACILTSKTTEDHRRNSPHRARLPGFAFIYTRGVNVARYACLYARDHTLRRVIGRGRAYVDKDARCRDFQAVEPIAHQPILMMTRVKRDIIAQSDTVSSYTMGAAFDEMLAIGVRPFGYFGEGGEGMRWGRRDDGVPCMCRCPSF